MNGSWKRSRMVCFNSFHFPLCSVCLSPVTYSLVPICRKARNGSHPWFLRASTGDSRWPDRQPLVSPLRSLAQNDYSNSCWIWLNQCKLISWLTNLKPSPIMSQIHSTFHLLVYGKAIIGKEKSPAILIRVLLQLSLDIEMVLLHWYLF